ncbi:hypothetical protein IFM58399_02756 [Aspergillus lentulus]|uniref:Magnesium transport protein CorA n=1 Tax=Aspergillus lentulus TaxID=293939 RepID=A0AAN6BLI5_ASPLE|nr:uncharacterized protein IFM58399_02756 [Aspergillus lentulus]KAF4156945.1 hypothetical protein CNMCM6069_006241 [Aspergillus lentulus]KAF4167003.1 hypothetical protein CNMCM6936_005789 [Aspergillus lentulus]KAF4176646.1 hypothetical protein CNMCM8060_006238 [Aspergillus lentulus]KAF4185435.1 hypothetical protein CNMCM7927_006758 [Aspergillus lentulus]KAF4195928.1 hypothetical protein CNMCM8694_005670 [Aspergillus lentulus]
MGDKQPISTDHEDATFSRLEASFSQTKVLPRRNSIEMKDIFRHAQASDLEAKDLDFNFSLDRSNYPLGNLQSLQDVFPAVQHDMHLKNPRNFSDETDITCLDVNENTSSWHTLDSRGLTQLLQSIPKASHTNAPFGHSKPSRLLAFFVPLIPEKHTSFASRISMTQDNTMDLFKYLNADPSFIMNLLGRPDYWAPQTRWTSDSNSNILACDFYCQHPRWNLHFQGAPLSVYLRYNAALHLTTYIISHKEGDSSIQALQNIFDLTIETAPADQRVGILLDDPFDLAVILSTLSFEASKYHAQRFRRYMWSQINKVDDHLVGLEANDRRKLGELTKELQIISQNADSHLGNADVAIITATAIRTTHARLHEAMGSPARVFERASDSITYVIESMQKQKIWFLNYKNRKDSTMALVYNLVTQQDAASNIQLAASMKRDSTSMNAIAALTMVFLPGTFIATILSAGSLNGGGDNTRFESASVWWLWAAITVPLTLVVMSSWWLYKKRNDNVRPAPMAKEDEDRTPLPKRGTFRSLSFSSWSRRDSASGKV